jgi:hypothetical protein
MARPMHSKDTRNAFKIAELIRGTAKRKLNQDDYDKIENFFVGCNVNVKLPDFNNETLIHMAVRKN